jgi:tRNA threonylcarbamoyladenosine biosynthesis protein TsaB
MMMGRPSAAVAPSLVIEASTYRATVAVVSGPTVLAHALVAMRGEREERLMPAVADALRVAGVALSDLDRVICGSGPGSFTSLRIGAAIAKGLCAPAGRAPGLGSVSSLLLVVAGALERLGPGSYWVSLDALRGERYAALVAVDQAAAPGAPTAPGPRIRWDGSWSRMPAAQLVDVAAQAEARLIGPDEAIEAWPDAAGVIQVWDAVAAEDPVSWEPSYGRLAEAEVRRAARLADA